MWIWFLKTFIAASLVNASKSAPTKPCVKEAILSNLTFLVKGIPRVWIFKIASRPCLSGTLISNSLSNLPGLLNAGSIALTLFVAPTTITFPLDFRPSIIVKSWLTTLLSTSPITSSLFGAMASISSIKIIVGAVFSASSKIVLIFFSLSPYHLLITSGPFNKIKFASDSFATALAKSVFPVPGGPWSKTPLGGLMPNLWKISGCFIGISTISLIFLISSESPPISS